MKHVRTFLSLLVVGLMLSGTAWAQGDLSLGEGEGNLDLSLALIDTCTFTSDSATVDLVGWTSSTDHPRSVGPDKMGYKVFAFEIGNTSDAPDTLTGVSFASFNDKDFSASRISLYQDGNSTPLQTLVDPGAFAENDVISFAGFTSVIPAEDTVGYYFTFDSDTANVDASYDNLFLGLKIFGGGITLARAGTAPTATDTLVYDCDSLTMVDVYGFDYDACNTGRMVRFDTKPPELTIDFEWKNAVTCAGPSDSTINLGDSIFITAWDTVETFEITKAWAYLSMFGAPTDSTMFADTIDVGADSGMSFGWWTIPDTVITPALDVNADFWYLHVVVEDISGNRTRDSSLIGFPFDNEKPSFDDDTVWMELAYDANGDGTAAIGDTVQVFAYFTSNPFGEVEVVTVDMSNWAPYGAAEPMTDPSGNRKWFSAKFEVIAGTDDWAADSSASLFTVTAVDNACNWDTLSDVAHFPVDNEAPFAPVQFLYERLMDLDSNAIINVGDSVLFTIDATNTDDLAADCEVVLDLYTPGLEGDPAQCVEDTDLADQHVFRFGIVPGTANALAGVHTVDVVLTDDAGNTADFTSSPLAQPIDNQPPLPVADLDATRGPCAIDLSWTMVNADDARYFIFWDGGDGWSAADTARDADGNLVFLDTLGSAVPPATSWTTDGTVTLTHGATYEFVVRTADDADNYEWNFARVATTADCEAPTVCINFPASGGAYGLTNPITVIAESPDADIASATLWIRDSDAGGGVPSAWMSLGAMTQVGGGQQFTKTVNDAAILGLFPGNTGDEAYEFITQGTDGVGNAQTPGEADAACDDFSFTWFHTALPVALVSVNDTILPQTTCGYNVTRDANNTVMLDVTNHVDGRTYTFDVFHMVDADPTHRIYYEENVGTIPYTFALDATDWPKGTNTVFVTITRDDGNVGQMSFDACAPDDMAPDATILYPIDGQRVRRMNSSMNPLMVWARVADWAYDPAPVSRVDFAQATSYDMATNYSVFSVQTAPAMGDTFQASWDTRAFEDGDVVYLQCTFYDDKNNTQTTPVITVTMDGQATDIMLTCPQAASINSVPCIAGFVDFYAEIQETFNDFTDLKLYYKKSTDPDIFSYWTSAGTMAPATDEGVYVMYNFNTGSLASDMNWDWRVIATDITGHVMFDYDGDGVFDDNTFDPGTWNSDNWWRVDNTPADFAFKQIEAGGITFYTPSTKLSGAGMFYVPARESITAWSQTIPMSDSFEVTRVNYTWYDPTKTPAAVSVAQVGPEPWYEATFNPYDLGLYTDDDVMNGYYSAKLVVSKEDHLNRTAVTDTLDVTILDADANQALVGGVTWGDYVWGDVSLYALAVNAYDLHMVIYEYRPDDSETWQVIDSVQAPPPTKVAPTFPTTFHTMGNVDDGWGWIRAVAVDMGFNRDENPIATKVYIANALPTAALTPPPADSSFIGDETVFTATADNGDIPIDSVQFMRKSVLSGEWSVWTTDDYPPYSALWVLPDKAAAVTDGAFHVRVRAWNRAGRYVDSDRMWYYYDATDPVISATKIAGQDVEAGNDPALDLTGMDVIEVEGAFWDNASWSGANSGIAKVAFEINNYSGSRVFYSDIDPATDGIHSVMFNISGLSEGQYSFYYRAWDAVGRMKMVGPVYGWISDHTAPVTAVIGHYGNRLYGYDWSPMGPDVARANFEYYDGTQWIGIGTATQISSSGSLERFWWTELNAASIPAGTHPFHMTATDESHNVTEGISIDVTSDGAGNLTFAAGTDLSGLAIHQNYENCVFEGVLRVDAASGNEPVVLGVYEDDEFGTDDYEYQRVDLKPYLQGTLFQEDVHPDDIFCGGKAIFFVGDAFGQGVASTMIETYRFRDDLGTNGVVYGNNDHVEVSIPPGDDHDGCLWVMETMLPRSGADQDRWMPIGNHNPGMANYIGCNSGLESSPLPGGGLSLDEDYCCCFDSNRYATIKMSYDPEVDLPAESLMVAWWNPWDGVWSPTGIYYLTGDEGFDTEAHTVEFSTDCLYGVYAVLAIQDPSHQGPISFEFVEANPWCNGYVGPAAHCYWPTCAGERQYAPKFVFKVVDWYSEIDPDMFEVKLDGHYLHRWGSDADYWTTSWDPISQELRIYPFSDEGGYGDYDDLVWASDLDCGDHTLWIAAKNKQANFATYTWDFEVDCTAPTVVFDNYYVSKNPTITFTVTDDMAGVDWDHVFVDVVAYETNNIDPMNPNQDENLFFYGTFFPGQVEYYADTETGEVTITTVYNLEHMRGIMVAIYDGTYSEHHNNYAIGDPVYYGDWHMFYEHGHGVWDCVGNSTDPWFQVLTIDQGGPTVYAPGEDENTELDYLPTECCNIWIDDDGAGFDYTNIMIYEDGMLLENGDETWTYDPETGYLHYCPTPGAEVMLVVTDDVGNTTTRTWMAVGEGGTVDLGDALAWPNPFDPSAGDCATIETNFAGDVTVTILDFAGEQVVSGPANSNGNYRWCGYTTDGEMVANGVYFAYCKAADGQHKVVKIAVISK